MRRSTPRARRARRSAPRCPSPGTPGAILMCRCPTTRRRLPPGACERAPRRPRASASSARPAPSGSMSRPAIAACVSSRCAAPPRSGPSHVGGRWRTTCRCRPGSPWLHEHRHRSAPLPIHPPHRRAERGGEPRRRTADPRPPNRTPPGPVTARSRTEARQQNHAQALTRGASRRRSGLHAEQGRHSRCARNAPGLPADSGDRQVRGADVGPEMCRRPPPGDLARAARRAGANVPPRDYS